MDSNLDFTAIGRRVRTFRKLRGYTQDKLAEMANISVVYVRNIENGNAKPSLPVFVRVAYALHVSLDEIVYGTPPFSPYDISAVIDGSVKSSKPNEREILIRTIEALKDILDDCL